MLDNCLISNFRDTVNENDWCLFNYRNVNNKNHWNAICSAMDWIDVSVEYINSHSIYSIRGNQSIELFSYISCIDIIVEAIEQLHRIFFSTSQQVFCADRDCFPDNSFGQCDREYFKSIRACFGAHPINLNDPDDPQNRNSRRFASWSGGGFGTGDFSVILYSNKSDGNDLFLDIHYNQIEQYLAKYYHHLETLELKIKEQYLAFCNQKANELFDCSGTPLEQLHVLKAENQKRLNNDYYAYSIDELIKIFESPVTCAANQPLVDHYLCHLQNVIDEIHSNLQNMTLVELSTDASKVGVHYDLPNGWHYCFEKLSEAFWGSGYHYFVWKNELESAFSGKFVPEYESIDELYVLVKAALYQMECNQQKG